MLWNFPRRNVSFNFWTLWKTIYSCLYMNNAIYAIVIYICMYALIYIKRFSLCVCTYYVWYILTGSFREGHYLKTRNRWSYFIKWHFFFCFTVMDMWVMWIAQIYIRTSQVRHKKRSLERSPRGIRLEFNVDSR